jgi:hypothetical protein
MGIAFCPGVLESEGAIAAKRQSAGRTVSSATYFSSDRAGYVRDAHGADSDRTKAAFGKKELPVPEPGSMGYRMSNTAELRT